MKDIHELLYIIHTPTHACTHTHAQMCEMYQMHKTQQSNHVGHSWVSPNTQAIWISPSPSFLPPRKPNSALTECGASCLYFQILGSLKRDPQIFLNINVKQILKQMYFPHLIQSRTPPVSFFLRKIQP